MSGWRDSVTACDEVLLNRQCWGVFTSTLCCCRFTLALFYSWRSKEVTLVWNSFIWLRRAEVHPARAPFVAELSGLAAKEANKLFCVLKNWRFSTFLFVWWKSEYRRVFPWRCAEKMRLLLKLNLQVTVWFSNRLIIHVICWQKVFMFLFFIRKNLLCFCFLSFAKVTEVRELSSFLHFTANFVNDETKCYWQPCTSTISRSEQKVRLIVSFITVNLT